MTLQGALLILPRVWQSVFPLLEIRLAGIQPLEVPTICVLLFLLSTLVGGLATAAARALSHRTGILDYPDARKVHARPIAYLGGLGYVLTMLIGVAAYSYLRPLQVIGPERFPLAVAFVVGLLAIFLVGLWDDVVGLRPVIKLLCQLAVAFGLWLVGVRIERISIVIGQPIDLMASSGPGVDTGSIFTMGQTLGDTLLFIVYSMPSILITIGWYAALMNAINLIDGLDGLAGGVCLIASFTLAAIGLSLDGGVLTPAVAITLVSAGGCLGFLFHNWHPAKIFLGDSGSMSLGYVLATASLISSTKAPALFTLLIPMIALGLPLFETVFSFTRRILTGKSPFKADRRHLHHRLMDAGLSQRRVVMVFLYATLYLGVNSLLLAQGRSWFLLLNVALLGVGLFMLIEFLGYVERRRSRSAQGVVFQRDPETGADVEEEIPSGQH